MKSNIIIFICVKVLDVKTNKNLNSTIIINVSESFIKEDPLGKTFESITMDLSAITIIAIIGIDVAVDGIMVFSVGDSSVLIDIVF